MSPILIRMSLICTMTTHKQRVLFICTGNSARSQMAEALLRQQAGDRFDVYSAGTQPEGVHPLTLKALAGQDLDTQSLYSKALDAFDNPQFDYVISLCDKARQECHNLPIRGKQLAWHFEDPKSRGGIAPFETTLREISRRITLFIQVETQDSVPPTDLSPAIFFKNLTDDIRLKCLMLIQYEGELCVCELMAAMQDIQPKVSRHLAILRKSGLLIDRRQRQWVYYRINPALPPWARSVIAETTDQNVGFIKTALDNLHHMPERPNTTTCSA